MKAVKQKQFHDAKSVLVKYAPGDNVWYASVTRQLDVTPKLRSPFDGPYLVIQRISDLNYRIQLDAKWVVHHDKLKPYLGTRVIPWAKQALKRSST